MFNPGDLSEFFGGYNGDCGETALAAAIAARQNRRMTFSDIAYITQWLIAHGDASSNGATTVVALAAFCDAHNVARSFTKTYNGDYWQQSEWHPLLLSNAGIKPILLEVANGQALQDVETGASDEAGVRYHYITVIGKQLDGYICTDGDNANVPVGGAATRYQIYSIGKLAAALPCGAIILA